MTDIFIHNDLEKDIFIHNTFTEEKINLNVLLSLKEIEYKNYEPIKYNIVMPKDKLIDIRYVNNKEKNKYYIYFESSNVNNQNNFDIIDFIYTFEIDKKDFKYTDIMICERIINRIESKYFNTEENALFVTYFYGFNFKIYFNSEISKSEFESFKLYCNKLNLNDRIELQKQINYNEKYSKLYKVNNISRYRSDRGNFEIDSDSEYI